jgi:hypothetical protein
MNVAEVLRRANANREPMRVRTFRLTDRHYDGLVLLARRHGLTAGAVLRAAVDELLKSAQREDARAD